MIILNCKVCGAPLTSINLCLFNVSESLAPWKGDYEAMARGEMSHAQHQLSVARWIIHNPELHSEKACLHAKQLTEDNTAVEIQLYPIVNQ